MPAGAGQFPNSRVGSGSMTVLLLLLLLSLLLLRYHDDDYNDDVDGLIGVRRGSGSSDSNCCIPTRFY